MGRGGVCLGRPGGIGVSRGGLCGVGRAGCGVCCWWRDDCGEGRGGVKAAGPWAQEGYACCGEDERASHCRILFSKQLCAIGIFHQQIEQSAVERVRSAGVLVCGTRLCEAREYGCAGLGNVVVRGAVERVRSAGALVCGTRSCEVQGFGVCRGVECSRLGVESAGVMHGWE